MSSDFVSFEKKALVPALIGAGLCLFLLKSGVFSFFFLAPLGFVAYRCHYRIAWLAFLFAFIGNVVIALGNMAGGRIPLTLFFLDIFYFAVMTFVFTWITAPPPGFPVKVSAPVRLIAGSCLGALVLSLLLFRSMASQGFMEYVNYFLKSLISVYISTGADVVQSARLEMLTAEFLMETIKFFMLRGGSLLSCVLLFFVCGQVSLFLARLTYGKRAAPPQEANSSEINSAETSSAGMNSGGIISERNNSLAAFHVDPSIIWVFSTSLLLVIFTRVAKLEIPEIILWNILVVCAILYFAQGLGIMQFFLARSSLTPFFRMLLGVLFVVILFSPFVNAVFLGGFVLLGIAENWAPLRASKQNGPPSTPEAGDGGN